MNFLEPELLIFELSILLGLLLIEQFISINIFIDLLLIRLSRLIWISLSI
jgi:hypothetical protein